MQTILAQQFKEAVNNWMRSPENSGKFSGKTRARMIIDEAEPKLARLFLLEYTERLCRGLERAVIRGQDTGGHEEEVQMRLLGPDFAALFVSVRERLPLKSGKKKQFALMTAAEIDESADAIWREAKKGAAQNIEKAEARATYLRELAREMRTEGSAARKLIFRDFAKLRTAGVEVAGKAKAGTARN